MAVWRTSSGLPCAAQRHSHSASHDLPIFGAPASRCPLGQQIVDHEGDRFVSGALQRVRVDGLQSVHTAVVLWERRKTRKTMEEIERMLDAAMTGSFSETNFDESQLSALETKFAHYLSAAEASSQNIAQEKDKIKTLIADISTRQNADCKPAVIQRAF